MIDGTVAQRREQNAAAPSDTPSRKNMHPFCAGCDAAGKSKMIRNADLHGWIPAVG